MGGGRDWSGQALAERLDITARTVRRDIDRLRELGYLITTVKGPGGGYRLAAGNHLPPMLFDDDQAIALAVALQTVTVGTAIADDAVRALATLRQVMPPRLRHRIDLLRVSAVQSPAERAPLTDGQVLVDVSRAIHAREELRFDRAPDPGTSADAPRRVHPHHLVTWRHRWYLVAWDLDREDWRTFRVDRLRPRTPNGPRFVPRELPGDVAAFVTGRFRGNDGTSTRWPCEGEVILQLPAADVAPFAEDGVVQELGSDRCRLTLGSWSWTGLAAALCRFGTDIEVVGPPELAMAFAELSARCARAARVR